MALLDSEKSLKHTRRHSLKCFTMPGTPYYSPANGRSSILLNQNCISGEMFQEAFGRVGRGESLQNIQG